MVWTCLSFFYYDRNKSKGRATKKWAFGGLVGIALKQFCRIPQAIIFRPYTVLETKNDGIGKLTPCQEKKLSGGRGILTFHARLKR
jgi:hypothetical protein